MPRLLQLALAIILVALAAVGGPGTAAAKTPGKTYCFNGICHTVRTLDETRALVGKTAIVKTSFYDSCKNDRYNPCGLTSSGEEYQPWRADNAASPIYPNGTKLLVWHPKTKKALVVRVNNAGPYWGDRKLDLSQAAGDKLGIARSGVATVSIRVLQAPTKAEATFKKNRTYAPVPGYIGVFSDIEKAFNQFGRTLATLLTPAKAEAATPKPAPAIRSAIASANKSVAKVQTARGEPKIR